jgi:hypothetical protein
MILVTNPEDLDRIEGLWVLWKEDADRLVPGSARRRFYPVPSFGPRLALSPRPKISLSPGVGATLDPRR